MNDHSMQNGAIEELLKSVNFMIQSALKNTTKIYNGFVVSNNNDGRWNIQYNGEIHPIQAYGAAVPTVGMIVKVIVPQGNQALSWFFVPIESSGSSGGNTFIPSVSQDGIISWTNDGGLPNPTPVNIRGPQGNTGEQGLQGETGPQGSTGPYFTPSVDSDGNLSWVNNGGLNNPDTVNIRGPQGTQGIQGPSGSNAIINGVESLNIIAQDGITGSQSGSTYTISGENIVSLISNVPLKYQETTTIGSSGWVQSGNQYYLQINFNNMSENIAPILLPQFDTDTSIQSIQQTEINSILYVQSFNGYIRIFATAPFTVDVSTFIYY